MYMCMLILDNPDMLDDLLIAWNAAGISGATILESTGSYNYRALRKQIPMRYLPGNQLALSENVNLTLFVIVEGKAQAEICLRETEKVVGDLDNPDSGVFTSWPLHFVKGISRLQTG